MTPAFWASKRVFLTGHTGFKGSWLTIWLNRLGANVRGYALEPPTEPSLFRLANVEQLCDSIVGDIRDQTEVQHAMRAFMPEIVIHMAAQPLVQLSYENPIETYSTNVMGTAHVLEAARHCSSVRAIVTVTSDKCYENREWVWGYRESDPLGGWDPYSSSKGAAEIVAGAYMRSYFSGPLGPKLATARAGNVIGGGDWAQGRLVPDIVKAFSTGREVRIRRPDAIRPWQHVLESLSGYLLLAEKLVEHGQAYSGGWNFGPPPDAVQSVRAVVGRIAGLWGEPRTWIDASNSDDPHEANVLKLDSTKARVQLDWKPRWSFDEALQATVAWYLNAEAGSPPRKLCLDQINQFVQQARVLPRPVPARAALRGAV